MKIKLLLCLQLIALYASAQGVIKGVVLDDKTNQPLPFASVYINYTTIGVNTDDKGAFTLTVDAGIRDLVASYIGHQPYHTKVNVRDGEETNLTIRLAVVPMKEFVITAKRDAKWQKQFDRFKKFFVGATANSKQTRILNPGVVSFPETKHGLFAAQATEPLEIENLSLGYRITYELKTFAVKDETFLLSGFARFQELQSNDSVITKSWTEKRKKAYEGSIRHLLKTIVEHCVDEEGYDLYEDRSDMKQVVRTASFHANLEKTVFVYPMQDKVLPGPKPYTYEIQFPSRLEIHYNGRNANAIVYPDVPFPISWLEVKDPIIVDDKGFPLNPLEMTLLGAMLDQRVAELLPNNYEPERKVGTYRTNIERKPLSKLAYLAERPYLQTDRSYYYPEEVVWFKGYMNYHSKVLKDSLSHVLHVELVDQKGNLVLDRRLPIDDNTIVGDFTIPSGIESGDYTLRAYTRWMLNFDPAYSFKKSIKILKAGELAKSREYNPDSTLNTVNILTEKNQFDTREKITVTIDTRDEYDRNIAANISVSVTDITQAMPGTNESTITAGFPMPVVAIPDTIDKRSRYLIQNGFDVKGKFIGKKDRQSKGLLRFVQQGTENQFVMATEEDGSFYAPNFLIYDTASLSVLPQTIKGKPGVVEFDTMNLKPRNGLATPLQIETYISERPVRYYIPDFTTATILKEVTIEAKKVEKEKTTLGTADFEVSGEWIRDSRAVDVLSALQMKVPGFRVIIRDNGGLPQKYIILGGGMNSFGSTKTQEPLVLIDRVIVNDMIGGPAAQVEMINPAEVEKVEIIKYGNTAAYGARGGNGVILISTGRRQIAEKPGFAEYDKSLLVPVPIKGFSSIRKFISPDYSTPEKNVAIPDNRSTIYWNPSIQIKDKAEVVSFFAADSPTRYRIVVEGVNAQGQPVRGEKIITVGKLP